MKDDYIPLAQTSSDEPWSQDDSQQSLLPTTAHYVPSPRSSRTSRRKYVFGSLIGVVLLALYFVVADWVEDNDDLDYSDTSAAQSDAHAAYIPFEPPIHLNASALARLRPAQVLPAHCREAHLVHGNLCYDPDIRPVDVLWTWVNGSDPLLQEAKLRAEGRFSGDDPYRPKSSSGQQRQYRDNDELRHSMRSVLENLRPYTEHFRLITNDFSIPANLSFPDDWRFGQVPQWLDMSQKTWTDDNIKLSLIHHAELFDPYHDTTFNSYGIESQFGNLQNISEYFIYLNDDFYLSNPLTLRSFYTSVYGVVLRFDPGIWVGPNKPSPDETRSEWRSMGESQVLLSGRFGMRNRPYVLHEAKSVVLPLLHEVSQMWPDTLAAVASHPFRETFAGSGDVSMLFLFAHFVVERWREALLWSWMVGKHSGVGGEWGSQRAWAAWDEIVVAAGMGAGNKVREVQVRSGWREALENRRVQAYLRASGHPQSDKTQYRFSSWDGYPYGVVDEQDHDEWASFQLRTPEDRLPVCSISYDECFTGDNGAEFTDVTDAFTAMAFQKPQCGDCAIQALVKASGRLGLSAFLPPADRELPRLFEGEDGKDDEEVPHLPLAGRWEGARFDLLSVMGRSRERNVRAWTLQLLQRYRFVVGWTPYVFMMLEDANNTRDWLGWVDTYADASMLCINDDVREGEEESVSQLFEAWQERRFGRPAAWERV